MALSSFRSSSGSAIVEFITFILFAQLLVLGSSLQVSEWLDRKVKLELLASQLARAEALGRSEVLLPELVSDYQLAGANVQVLPCGKNFTCVSVSLGDLNARGVSLRNGL